MKYYWCIWYDVTEFMRIYKSASLNTLTNSIVIILLDFHASNAQRCAAKKS